MQLTEIWPLFGLRLTTPRLDLAPIRESDLPEIVDAALAGVHPPEAMPFQLPWTSGTRKQVARRVAQYYWADRGELRPASWRLVFGIRFEGALIGIQELVARDFARLRTVSSGSWLTQASQGRGIGSEMRAAILLFAFDHLGAERAETEAIAWNERSIRISKSLGYRDNGTRRIAAVAGSTIERCFAMEAAELVRPDWELRVTGGEAARAQLLGEDLPPGGVDISAQEWHGFPGRRDRSPQE